jgi:hypothetical protein
LTAEISASILRSVKTDQGGHWRTKCQPVTLRFENPEREWPPSSLDPSRHPAWIEVGLHLPEFSRKSSGFSPNKLSYSRKSLGFARKSLDFIQKLSRKSLE